MLNRVMPRVSARALLPLIFMLGSCSMAGRQEARTYPGALRYPLVTVDALARGDVEPGSYDVVARVVDVRQCSCPRGALCTPCPPDGLFVADGTPSPSRDDPAHERAVFVRADQSVQFEANRWYRFSIEVEPVQDFPIALLGYDVMTGAG